MSLPEDHSLEAAAAAGLLASEDAHRALLESIVEVARAIFRARSASIFVYDDEADELVFEAVTEAEAQGLVGRRFPSSRGVAGWVLVTRQPLILDDVGQDPRFARWRCRNRCQPPVLMNYPGSSPAKRWAPRKQHWLRRPLQSLPNRWCRWCRRQRN